MRRRLAAVGLALATSGLAGCAVTSVATPNPETIPSGSPQAHGAAPTGPIVELHRDRVAGVGWRYLIYPSAEGWCTQFETVASATAGCGDLLPDDGRAFGSVGRLGGQADALRPIEGIVTGEVATVWLVDADAGTRVPALLLPLDDAGLEGSAFIGFEPDGATISHLLAMRINGEVLETYELP